MENFDIYKDIAERTNGDLYIGVSGPVRTGKSTFISRFMENFVIPNIENPLERQIATDEMPIAGDGKTVMTTQPKFIPANAVKVKFNNNATANVKLIDCVGYFVEGANGNIEDGKQDMQLSEPEITKKNGQCGVKIKAKAPSLHIVKVDVCTEINPIVGTEKQGEEIVEFINEKYKDSPKALLDTNLFGKTLNDLVKEGLSEKIMAIPKDTTIKVQKTLTRMVNENRGGMICILL